MPSTGKGPDGASALGPVNTATGLTSEEAGRRLKQFGPNAVPDTTENPFRRAIVFGNQATTYAIRERRRLWSSCPSFWLGVSSVADILIASTLAVGGIFMTPLPVLVVAGTLAAAVVFAFVVDAAKRPVFGRLGIA